jgi:Ca2+-binding RTX toxin-like protein
MHMPPFAGKTAALLVALASIALPGGASAAPSCAEGPQTVGTTIVGTDCPDTIHAPRGVTVVNGEGGDDAIFGGRGNERLFGGEGNDRLYGGIGDDQLRGGNGNDLLSGGFGADSALDGGAGSDFVRGDATIDSIGDSGEDGGFDTLSYATGVTPGFDNQGAFFDYEGFPNSEAGRGVFIDLEDDAAADGNGFANNGRAPAGGGVDLDLDGESFERVIGTAFPDFILGSAGAEEIFGGGGADVLRGEGGADQIQGGTEGDSCSGAAGSVIDCERSDAKVEPRNPATVATGLMTPAGVGPPALYLTGSTGGDVVTATYSKDPKDPNDPPQVAFAIAGSSTRTFVLSEPPDSLLLAGLGGNDTLTAVDFPETTSVVLLGGDGSDVMTGGGTEDAVVDGPGNDSAAAGDGDDAVPNNAGDDDLAAESGDDLFVSDAICEGDTLDGGPGRDNANWAQFKERVTIDMRAQAAGEVGAGGQAQCPSFALLTRLVALEDIEGTSFDDFMIGDASDNQLLGRPGHDAYFAAAGNDSILANSGDQDLTIDCGEGFDTALVDFPQFGDPPAAACESVEAREADSFRPPDTPPDPNPEPETPFEGPVLTSPPPAPEQPSGERLDRAAPTTALGRRPARLLFSDRRFRRVAFAFRSNETGVRFRCRLDRSPFRPCRSPRAYRVALGRHAFRFFAVDAAGNRGAAAAFRFRLRRR